MPDGSPTQTDLLGELDRQIQERPWLSDWSPSMQLIGEEVGFERLYRAGLDVLGFPPTWPPTTSDEVRRLRAALKQGA